jgi:aspartyl-tRNA(Asn)/glutamyl-tRNA(Gln) amidotransferase subunit A
VPVNYFLDVCDSAIRSGYDSLLRVPADAGAEIVEVEIPSAAEAQTIGYQVLFAEAAALHAEHHDRAGDYDPVTLRRINQGLLTPAVDYIRCLQFRHELQSEIAPVFGRADLLVLPATPSTAPDLEELMVTVDGTKVPLYEGQARSTMICNLSGVPGLVLPTGFAADGCPVAVQLVAPPHREQLALRVAAAYQDLTAHHRRVPPAVCREATVR